MKKKRSPSFSVRLSVLFMFVLTSAVIVISVFFLLFVSSLVRKSQAEELRRAEQGLAMSLEQDGASVSLTNIPYYISYVVYDQSTGELVATNDPFLPLLKPTGGRCVHFVERDFFFDGNLDILYCGVLHSVSGQELVIATVMNMDNNSLSQVLSKLPAALLILIIPILAVSFFVALLIAKKTIAPVMRITKAAQAMTTERLSDLLPVTGRDDEIDELSKTFNDLFLRIKNDFDRERQFSSDVSHELNTPLTVISGQAGLLLRWGKKDPEQLEKSLRAIKDEAKSMHSIISNLLQISRLESGRIRPQISEVRLDDMFLRIKEEFSSVSDGGLSFVCDGGSIVLATDSELLHQLLTILVSNSVKFSGGECTVTLKSASSPDGITVTESDDGPGISKEVLPHIFERFYRADEAHSRGAGGSGLGLAIAGTLCSALGAEISAQNGSPCGASFSIRFPRAS